MSTFCIENKKYIDQSLGEHPTQDFSICFYTFYLLYSCYIKIVSALIIKSINNMHY